MGLTIDEMTPEAVGRRVVYNAGYPGAPNEYGRITSYNSKNIFVDFQNVGRGQACTPSDLRWDC